MKISNSTFIGSCQRVEDKPKRRAPEFAFIGRSNVGKSSLINMLCAKKDLARTSAMPGKTVLINHFMINDSWYLVDLPGYGFAKLSKVKQQQLKKMIQDYVGKSEELAMLFILIDSRHKLMEIDKNFIEAVAQAGVKFSVIFTKCDKLSKSELARTTNANITQIAPMGEDISFFTTSSEKNIGRDEILDYIENILNNIPKY
ncbi:MAG: YihA family ribosome biogenesis GTP-binding protein [Bacteroidales bacterium]|jgi:GTP-binding protein|nr:YihA family ribosome biogenesis GTP-binding protein [Bacteroidales bacterium]MBO7283552.1 YihA family ribosome biogenesis GTP-binding protein [Bacteroidales bacterium]MBR4974606.1 YihA family ribosome biogenesis GTP-binding protein [Bacteroidales bacterium]